MQPDNTSGNMAFMDKKIKVAIMFDLTDPEMGGSYTFNELIFDSLARNRFNYPNYEFLSVYSNNNNVGIKPDIPLPDKFDYRLKFAYRFFRQMFSLKFFYKGINFESCRSAALNDLFSKNSISVVWAVQPLGVRLNCLYLTTSWDIAHRITPYFPEISLHGNGLIKRDKVANLVFSSAFRIIVGTNRGMQEVSNAYGINLERILVNPFPVKLKESFTMVNRFSNQVIYPANFWPHKNHLILIEALKLLHSRSRLNFKLILTGANHGTEEKVRDLASLNSLSDFVEFRGFVTREELEKLYKESSFLIYPSLAGPDNLPPLEALAYGCPISISDIPGAREQFGEFANYFDPFDVEAVAAAFEAGIANSSRPYSEQDLISYLESKNTDKYFVTVMKEIEKLRYIVFNDPSGD